MDTTSPLLVDLCQTDNLDLPHLVYSSTLSDLIFNQMGKSSFLVNFPATILILDALNTHILSTTEFYLEPLDCTGRIKVMLILTPVLSKFIIPYFSSALYRERLG